MITLVTGAVGQLGRAIVRAAAHEDQMVALPRAALDVTVQADVREPEVGKMQGIYPGNIM